MVIKKFVRQVPELPRWWCSISVTMGTNAFIDLEVFFLQGASNWSPRSQYIHSLCYMVSWQPFMPTLLYSHPIACCFLILLLNQQNVNRSRCHTQTTQTLRLTPPVLSSNSRCSDAPLEICKVISDSARAFSGATGCYEIWLIGYSNFGVIGASAQLSGRLNAEFLQHWFFGFHNQKAFGLSDSSLLQSQDSLHPNMACIIYLSLPLYIHMANLAADCTRA